MCGAPGDEQCSEATCGGALCRDIFGNRKCGGPYCKGTLPVAHSATEEAKKTEKKIPTLLTQLEDSEKEVFALEELHLLFFLFSWLYPVCYHL